MKIVFTPDWFLGKDVLIEIFSFIVLLAFFIIAYRSYKLTKNKNSLWLGIGFLLIAVAELATTLTKIVLFYDTSFTHEIGKLIVTYNIVKTIDIFYYIGFFFHKILTLLGFYIIYRLSAKQKSKGEFLLVLYFIIISAIISSVFNYIFHLTALILLIFIINNYFEIYKKNKNDNTKVLIIALSMLALSQLIFIMSNLETFYVVAQIIQLVSYLILLFLMIRILKYGEKKKQN